MTAAEVEFLLDALEPVVDGQPTEHPLRRVDRDNSRVYETGEALDMQTPLYKRTEDLEKANYVGVASQSTDPTPAGPNNRYELITVCSVRLEGLTSEGGEWGHIDPDAYGGDSYGSGGYGTNDGVPFSALFRDVFDAIKAEMSYPAVGRPGVSYCDLTITNVDKQLSNWSDFYRAEFDVQFRGYTDA